MKYQMWKRIIVAALCLLMLCTVMPMEASAASSSCTLIRGNSSKAVTFTVETGSRFLFKDKITFKQTKGSFNYMKWFGGEIREDTKGCYDSFTITVQKVGGKTSTYTLSGSSKTIKLDKNSTYIITVTPGYPILKKGKVFRSWTSYPTWSISKVKGINLCY